MFFSSKGTEHFIVNLFNVMHVFIPRYIIDIVSVL